MVDVQVMNIKMYMLMLQPINIGLNKCKVGVEFKTLDVPLEPYLLGLWLGDSTKQIVYKDRLHQRIVMIL